MPGRRRRERSTNIWPGFVDALGTLLMVIIFLLMVFVLAQFFLGEALSGRDEALRKLQGRVLELGELLSLEKASNDDLRGDIAQMSDELKASIAQRDTQTDEMKALSAQLKVNETAGEKLRTAVAELEALQALKEELEAKIAAAAGKLNETGTALLAEKELSKSARAEVAMLTKQMRALRDQVARLNHALEASEKKSKEQGVQITALGKRLNTALASKVAQLARYRSEFFGRLREVLGKRSDVQIVGDRFVFQSEVLFSSGSADLGQKGKAQLATLAEALREITKTIPKDIDWILRIDGHTDAVPIHTEQFPSNWELSSARAISVVRYLMSQKIDAQRLAAAGFGSQWPLDKRRNELAYRKNRRIELKLTQR